MVDVTLCNSLFLFEKGDSRGSRDWFSLVSIIHRSFSALVLRTGGPPSTIPFRVTLSFQLMGVSFSCDSDNLPKDVAFVIFCHFIAKVGTHAQ